jgi:hypothetical protein
MRVHQYPKTKLKTKRKRVGETSCSLRESSANQLSAKSRENSAHYTPDKSRSAARTPRQAHSKRVTIKNDPTTPGSLRTAGSQLKRVNQSKQTGPPALRGTHATAYKPRSVTRTSRRANSAKSTYAIAGKPRSVIRPSRRANSAIAKAKVSVDSCLPSSSEVVSILPCGSPDVLPSSQKQLQIPKVRLYNKRLPNSNPQITS